MTLIWIDKPPIKMKLKLRVKTRILVTKTTEIAEFIDVQMVESSHLSADVSDKNINSNDKNLSAYLACHQIAQSWMSVTNILIF